VQTGAGDVPFPHCFPAGLQCADRRDHARDEQGSQSDDRGVPHAHRPAVLADVVADEDVLGFTAQRGRELDDRVLEAWVAQAEVCDVAGPAQVDVPWLGPEPVEQCDGQGGRGRGVDPLARDPAELASGQADKEVVLGPVLEPVPHLARDARRVGRGRRRQQDEVPGRVKRTLDRAPEPGIGRKARVVPEHAKRTKAVPRLVEPMQRLLQRQREGSVGPSAVGDERVEADIGTAHRVPVHTGWFTHSSRTFTDRARFPART
jgi:hypothetical protein